MRGDGSVVAAGSGRLKTAVGGRPLALALGLKMESHEPG
jgi:hypothetical protein